MGTCMKQGAPVTDSIPPLPLTHAASKNSSGSVSRIRLPRLQELGLIVVVLILAAILSIYGYYDAAPGRPNTFLNKNNFIDGIATPMSYYAIMAVGLTIVIITSGIDISVGSMLALAALGSAALLQRLPHDASAWQVLPLAFGSPLGIGLLAGLINGGLVVVMRMQPFIVTLGTL